VIVDERRWEEVANVSTVALSKIFQQKYGYMDELGWGPKQRLSQGYFTPDDIYEATVSELISSETRWLDVGCGRELFPGNPGLGYELANRCRRLAGLDPSDNIDQNPFLHDRFKMTLEDFAAPQLFDLITLRMVAEHISNPGDAVKILSKAVKPGGRVVILTVYRWSPIPIVSSILPFALHHKLKKVFWQTEERDTFPTEYLMNTRGHLERWLESEFEEEQFTYVDDCRTLGRWQLLNSAELHVWKLLNNVGLHYPEVCLLGIYRRRQH